MCPDVGHIVICQKARDHVYSPSKDLQELSHSVKVVSLIDEPTKNTIQPTSVYEACVTTSHLQSLPLSPSSNSGILVTKRKKED